MGFPIPGEEQEHRVHVLSPNTPAPSKAALQGLITTHYQMCFRKLPHMAEYSLSTEGQ